MSCCWVGKPESRPSFSALVTEISSQLLLMADYMDISVSDAATQVAQDAQISIIIN